MGSPVEYDEDGEIFLEGRCAVCGAPVRTEVTEIDVTE
jgi:hypothetical protein